MKHWELNFNGNIAVWDDKQSKEVGLHVEQWNILKTVISAFTSDEKHQPIIIIRPIQSAGQERVTGVIMILSQPQYEDELDQIHGQNVPNK